MRPDRPDIPLPPFPPGMPWIGPEPIAAERLTARGPLLVHFFEVGELSSVQSLPVVEAWSRHYAEAGLSTVGVHTPRSDLARSPEALAAALERLGVSFPVCADVDYAVWHAYGCKGWPSLFLWGRGGRLRWFHFGLADIEASEAAIREELQAGDEERELPEPLAGPPRGGRLRQPSEEVFPGGSHRQPWTPGPGEPLEIEYAGGGAWAALDGSGRVHVRVDGKRRGAHSFEVGAPGVYRLSEHRKHGRHEVRLELEGDVRVWSVAFAPGPP